MISLITAMDRQGLIGLNGSLPWYRPADLKNFSKLTRGKTVIMGRLTYESIGSPLPKRHNVVVTNQDYKYKDGKNIIFASASTVRLVLDSKQWSEDIFIIGGSSIYKEFAPYIGRMYLTVIDQKTPIDGDPVYFPWSAFENSLWKCTEQKMLDQDFYYVFDRG